ncbi:SPOR domain-containing protein [Novosphingobium bradum]|uniref:SPOR domain-containing protein n=1 Tax=Novosphingobium bradum TaxID=1737444 RepID=A0ABV7IR98_9SPHN
MRLPVDRPSALGLIALALAAGGIGALAAPLLARAPAPAPLAPSGPAADYPMVLGAPFTVDGVTYSPSDTMNYDQVGYAVAEAGAGAGAGAEAGPGISLAHRTLPLPSYVEVTSLRTGRTILARVERRGPMTGHDLVALSAGAAVQLGADGRTPVRVRRVNPPEMERALLRARQTAPLRMDTPMSLVNVLLRKLDPALVPPPVAPPETPVAAAPSAAIAAKPANAQPAVAAKPTVAAPRAPATPAPKLAGTATASPRTGPIPQPAPKPTAQPAAKPAPGKPGALVVQVGAFSTHERAEKAARQVGGTVTPAGKLFRVRIAGLGGQAEAAGALAKARGAGYSDARIQRAD